MSTSWYRALHLVKGLAPSRLELEDSELDVFLSGLSSEILSFLFIVRSVNVLRGRALQFDVFRVMHYVRTYLQRFGGA